MVYNSLKRALSSIYPSGEARAMALRIMEHFTGMSSAMVMAQPEMELEESVQTQLTQALEQCLLGVPLQYVLGETEFYGHKFKVSPAVLIPRPETEELVDWIVKDLTRTGSPASPTILDIGTGSGCIAISLALAIAHASVVALDVSAEAINIAQTNAKLNSAHIQFIQHNILEVDSALLPDQLDIIVSNPPYVCNSEQALMHNNVLKHEPHLALFVTDNKPLIFYEAIARHAQLNLSPSGSIYVEINEALGPETVQLFEQAGFKAELRKDLSGRDRMVKANR